MPTVFRGGVKYYQLDWPTIACSTGQNN